MDRPRHRVSVKVALVNKKRNKVLLTRLHDGGYGLPGGHIEGSETPEQALDRELQEELELASSEYVNSLQRSDFWRDSRTDRIILRYRAYLDDTVLVTPNEEEMVGIYWASLNDFDRGDVSTSTYEMFIRKVLTEK